MNPALWLLILGLILQLAAGIGYFANRSKTSVPTWVIALAVIGWVLFLIAAFYVFGGFKHLKQASENVVEKTTYRAPSRF